MATDRSTRWWLIPVIALIVLFTAGAGLAARHYYPNFTNTSTLSLAPESSSSSSAPPSQSTTVVLSADANTYPQSSQIRQTLQNYFDAINKQDYKLWTTAVTKARLDYTKGEQNWRKGLKSTTDTSIVISRIEAAPGNRLSVLLSFTSWQNLQDAPPYAKYPCILWNVVWPFAQQDNMWKLDLGDASLIPAYAKCGS